MLLATLTGYTQTPEVRMEDKIRIAEAIKIRNEIGPKVWDGIQHVPFAILLVTETTEFLFNHPYPSADFQFLENDTLTHSKIYYRPAQYPTYFQAAFPAVNGVSCVVIGTPENTTKSSSTRWVLTLLHENFHQYQTFQPYYYSKVAALGLSGGDETGMWQLNYAFPYTEKKVNSAFNLYREALGKAVHGRTHANFEQLLKASLHARTNFKNSLSEQDYAYFTFQLWQEGIARYTEFSYLEALATYKPTKKFMQLDDYESFTRLKISYLEEEFENLKNQKLSNDKRLVVYTIGLAEGLLLDTVIPNWKNAYLSSLVSPITLLN